VTGAQIFVLVALFALVLALVLLAAVVDDRAAYREQSDRELRRELRRHPSQQDTDQ
jgi:heme exporter protein D